MLYRIFGNVIRKPPASLIQKNLANLPCVASATVQNRIQNFHKSHSFSNSKSSTLSSKLDSVATSSSTATEDLGDWIPIYRLPIIRIAAAFNKIKVYQFALTLFGSPISFYAESIGQLPEGGALIFTSLGVTGSITLILASLFTKNLIGFIYIRPNSNDVKISFIDFWGNRQNCVLTVDQILPPDETNRSKLDLYQIVKTTATGNSQSTPPPAQTFKLLQRLGTISDTERFTYIFGE